MIVCHCRGVSDREIVAAVAEGATSLDEVGMACGAGAHCGGCRGHVQELLQRNSTTPPPSVGGGAPLHLPVLAPER